MIKQSKFLILAHLCSVYAITVIIIWILDPHPFRGFSLRGFSAFIALILGYVLSIAHMVKQEKKSFLFHQKKLLHALNWFLYILALLSVAIATAFLMR